MASILLLVFFSGCTQTPYMFFDDSNTTNINNSGVNYDGGFSNAKYLATQNLDGGFAASVYSQNDKIDGGIS